MNGENLLELYCSVYSDCIISTANRGMFPMMVLLATAYTERAANRKLIKNRGVKLIRK